MKNNTDSDHNTYGYGLPKTRRTIFGNSPEQSEKALTEVLERYRQALVKYLRSKGRKNGGLWHNETWISEVVDAFIAEKLWRKEFLQRVQFASGRRFRPYLKSSLYHFAVDKWRHDARTGADQPLPPRDPCPPGECSVGSEDDGDEFGVIWARELLKLSLERMKAALSRKHDHKIRWEIFVRCFLLPLLGKGQVEPTTDTSRFVSEEFGRELTAAQVSDWRKKAASSFRDHLLCVLSETCTSYEDIDEELVYFIQLLRKGLRLHREDMKTHVPTIIRQYLL